MHMICAGHFGGGAPYQAVSFNGALTDRSECPLPGLDGLSWPRCLLAYATSDLPPTIPRLSPACPLWARLCSRLWQWVQLGSGAGSWEGSSRVPGLCWKEAWYSWDFIHWFIHSSDKYHWGRTRCQALFFLRGYRGQQSLCVGAVRDRINKVYT